MAEGMTFKITVALRASRVEKWIHNVNRDFLDVATTKCVGLDCEFIAHIRVGLTWGLDDVLCYHTKIWDVQ
jgi:hypothetical protein